MAAPTLSQSVHDPYNETGSLTGVISWNAGDLILAVAAGEAEVQVVNTPTGTGLDFITLQTSALASDCFLRAWVAFPTVGGSGVTVTATVSGVQDKGMSLFVFSGHGGIGNWAMAGNQAGTTISLNRGQDNSAVVFILADFTASTDVTVTPSPASGATQHVAVNHSGAYSVFVFSWTDQGAAGNASYGFSAGGSTDNAMFAIEIRGTNPGATPADRLMPYGR